MLIKCTLEVVEVVIFDRNSSGGGGIFYVEAVTANTRNYLKFYAGDLKNVTNITK